MDSTGLNQTHREHAAGSGANSATWTFTGLAAGGYDVSITWVGGEGRATDAPFSVYDDMTPLTGEPLRIDQRSDPFGAAYGGLWWESLGTFVIGSGTLKVTLTDDADGTVAADAVRLVSLGTVPTTSGIADQAVLEDAADTTIDLWSAFADAEDLDEDLYFEVADVVLTGGPGSHFFSDDIDQETGQLTLSYSEDAYGAAAVTVRAYDTTGLWADATFSVTVTPENDAPVIYPIDDVTANAESELVLYVNAWDVEDVPAARDPDDPYGALTFSLEPGAPAGVQLDAESGRLDWTPTTEQTSESPYGITVTVTDSEGLTAQTTINVTVADPLPPLPPKPNLLVNGSFDLSDAGGAGEVTHSLGWDVFPSIPGWTLVSGDNFELHEWGPSSAPAIIQAADGDQYLELDADYNGHNPPDPPGEQGSIAIQQTITDTVPGATYELSFAFAARPNTSSANNVLEVHVWDAAGGNDLVTPATAPELDPNNRLTAYSADWVFYTFPFVAEGTETTIYFADAGTNDTKGTYLDFVSLRMQAPRVTKVEFIPLRLHYGGESLYAYGTLDRFNPDGKRDAAGGHASNLPAFAGGKRFFPDAQRRNEVGRNAVLVRAIVEGLPKGSGTKVFFRSFDVDDPDPRNDIDPNGNAGTDNRGWLKGKALPTSWRKAGDINTPAKSRRIGFEGYLGDVRDDKGNNIPGTTIKRGGTIGADWTTGTSWAPAANVDGKAQVEAYIILYTSFAPGDNYRVAASCDRVELDKLQANAPSAADYIPTKPNNSVKDPYLHRGAISEQLTVWRKVFLELDEMAAPVASKNDYVKATATVSQGWDDILVDRDKKKIKTYRIKVRLELDNRHVVVTNEFDRGVLRTADGRNFRIEFSKKEKGSEFMTLYVFPKAENVNLGIDPGATVRLYEDDFDDSTKADKDVMADETLKRRVDPSDQAVGLAMIKRMGYGGMSFDRTKNRFADAYIEPAFFTDVTKWEETIKRQDAASFVPWKEHLSDLSVLNDYRGSQNWEKPWRWIVHISSAYEMSDVKSNDWRNWSNAEFRPYRLPTLGLAERDAEAGNSSSVTYVETIWDSVAQDKRAYFRDDNGLPVGLERQNKVFETELALTTVHEVGHQCALARYGSEDLVFREHRRNRGSIMYKSHPNDKKAYFALLDIVDLRTSVDSPGMGDRTPETEKVD